MFLVCVCFTVCKVLYVDGWIVCLWGVTWACFLCVLGWRGLVGGEVTKLDWAGVVKSGRDAEKVGRRLGCLLCESGLVLGGGG